MGKKIIGFDIGTGNLICAKPTGEAGKREIHAMRDMFLSVSPEDLAASEIANTQLDYVELYDGDELETIAIVGEDAYRFANIFGQPVRRPMQQGVLSTKDVDAIDVIALMVEKLAGKAEDGYCVYSVPAQAVDLPTPPVLYHEKVFGKIFEALGYESKPMNEGMSVIFSECAKENFTGIGISFGAGLTNVACSYKGAPTLTFAVSRGGDWIDKNVAESVGKLQTRITAIKEKDLNLDNPNEGKKEERRIKQSLVIYYENLIRYVLKIFVSKFKETAEGLSISEKIPIILSGGTSKADGFRSLFDRVFREQENQFPYDISEIRLASDQMNAVAIGNLEYALWEQQRNTKTGE